MLPKRVCSLENFEFAPEGICSLESYLLVCVYINTLITPFRTDRRKSMSMNGLAIAGNFFLFIVYGPFWIELFFGIS